MNTQQKLFNPAGQATRKATPAAKIPAWVRAHLETTTGDDYAPGAIRRNAKPRPCPHCHSWYLAGLDADRAAFEAHADPLALTAGQELACMLSKRRTYEIHQTGKEQMEIDYRDRWRISGHPAGGKMNVIAEHVCNKPVGTPIIKTKHKTYPPGAPAPF